MNFLPLVLVCALLHAYIAVRIAPALADFLASQIVLLAVLVVSALLMPLGLLARRMTRQPLADVLSWAGLLFMGLFSSVFVLTVLRDLFLSVGLLVNFISPAILPLHDWRIQSAKVVPLLGLLITLVGFLNARRTAAVVRVDVPIKGLPVALQGFTVVQISDVHIGPTIKKRYLQRVVVKVNALHADMVAITGDLVDGKVSELAKHVAPLADLQSHHGTYFVTGNHEYYSGAHAWIDELRRLGINVLMNEHVVLHHSKSRASTSWMDSESLAPLVLAGVTDFNAHLFDPTHRSDPEAALAGAPLTAPVRILLAHQPRTAIAAAKSGFDLQISGHTHGGQFYPWNLFVRFQQPFTSGLHKLENLWVYTSRGTGYWGPPKRFGAPSEITFLRLVTA